MNSRTWPAALLLLASLGHASAARIAEPDTILYGRVSQRLGERVFAVTRGQLVWTFRTSVPAVREFRLTTTLRPQLDGRSSFQLRIPHQLLANDLAVGESRVAVTGGSQPLQLVAATLDGQPLAVAPATVSDFSVTQRQRARAWNVDLELAGSSVDSDGDGLPDWWEDEQGLDKWTPNEPSAPSSNPSVVGTPAAAAQTARTFAEWRAAFFPRDQQPLDRFGEQDPDGDGIPNLVEYAFDLDPTRPEGATVTTSPRMIRDASRTGIAFRRRTIATDLEFRVDVSENLGEWRDGTSELEPTAAPADAPQLTALVLRDAGASPDHRFLRLRIVRR